MATGTALVTGAAGFIGYYTSKRLLDQGWSVIGFDAMTDYYERSLKDARRAMLDQHPAFSFVEDAVETPGVLQDLFEKHRFDAVVHLAAQAGVRMSIDAPRKYLNANIAGTFELLEAARACPPSHMLLASSSSVYGGNVNMPYRETDQTDGQMSFYGATKKATETMTHSYAHLFGIPTTMFRFFTVYGPWGRPDMAHFKFTRAILEGNPIDVYNHGQMKRDFTYVDDLVTALVSLLDVAPPPPDAPRPMHRGDSLSPVAPFRVVNIGNGAPVSLMEFIGAIETATGRTAEKNMLPMQPGDIPATWADTTLLRALTGYEPQTNVSQGIQHFVDWYREYYNV